MERCYKDKLTLRCFVCLVHITEGFCIPKIEINNFMCLRYILKGHILKNKKLIVMSTPQR